MAFNVFSLFLVIMNALGRWKIVLALIATFAVGAGTGGLLTSRAIREAARCPAQPRRSALLPTMDRLQRDLRLKREQSEKVNPILRQMSDEIGNLRSLTLREIEGILSRGQDRMSPILEPDQRTRLQHIIEEYRQLVGEELNIPEPSVSPSRAPVSADKETPH
jgi:hypothetical protein